jgi:hypothetical protein
MPLHENKNQIFSDIHDIGCSHSIKRTGLQGMTEEKKYSDHV